MFSNKTCLLFFLVVKKPKLVGDNEILKDDTTFGKLVSKAGLRLKAKNKPNEISKFIYIIILHVGTFVCICNRTYKNTTLSCFATLHY